jgi:2-methylcitrate dehydratase PrpD
MKTVLGLACSMASGMQLNFGTMTKPFHVGYAAKNGIEAAELVNLGLTSNEQIFDTEIGMFNLYGDEGKNYGNILEKLGNPWEVEKPGFNIKRYPCCYATHRAIDAMELIVQRETIDPDDVEKIECLTPHGSLAPVIYKRPRTGLEGKFSIEYVISAMLVDHKVNTETFTDEKVSRKIIQQLIPKVYSRETSEIKTNRDIGDLGYILLSVQLKNGRKIEEKVYYAKGSFKKPLTTDELYTKFVDCFKSSKNTSEVQKVFERLMNLERVENIKELI